MTDKDDRKKGPEATVDLGFGGLFKGLGNFIDLLGEMVQTGQEQVTRTGEFRIKGLDEKARGVYGVSVRMGIGGAPEVERFGNIRPAEEGAEVVEVREPLVDVFDEGDEIVVVAELPGVNEAEIAVEVKDDILSLETTGDHKFAKEVVLAHGVDASTLRKSYRNGIIEVRLKKA